MLFTTLPQLIVLAVLLVGGIFIGLGLHPGGVKWKKRFNAESANYGKFRRDADHSLREANQRIAALERDNAALADREAATRKALTDAEFKLAEIRHNERSDTPPIVAEPAPTAGLAVPIAATAATPAFPVETQPVVETEKKSWFSMGGTPDLSRIRGIDAGMKTRLSDLGVTRFEDVTELSDVDEIALEQRLSLPAGYITREQWRDQAALLKAGQDKEHAERFGER